MVEMKDSGISWVGMIPKHWNINKGKYFIDYIERAVRDDDEVVTCFRDGEVTLRSNRREDGFTVSEKEIGYQGINEGDLIVHGMDGFAGAIGISDSKGKASPVLNVLEPNGDKRFYMYYLRNMAYGNVFLALSTGIRVRTCDTNWKKLRELPYLIPPVEEQIRIADYIEKKCSEIDALHSDIEKQIETLEEYKKSVITEAVTKGLNPDVEMKDSGIEWIGMIPKDWLSSKIKYHAEIKGRIGFKGYTEQDLVDESEGAITLSPSNFNEMKMNYNHCTYISWFKYEESPEIMIENGDTLFVKTGSSYGKACFVEGLPKEATINPQLIVFKNININKKLFSYIVQANYIKYQSELAVVGGTIPTMSQNKIGNFSIIVPPNNKQEEIVDYLDYQCREIDNAIDDKKKQLVALEEYKKSLIYEFVTGKKEVPDNE